MAAPGCQYVTPIAVQVGIQACVEMVKSLLDSPTSALPSGFRSCGASEWWVRGQALKYCTYCNPQYPGRVYLQFGCNGVFYPMDVRPLDHPTGVGSAGTPSLDDQGPFLTKLECREMFFIKIQGEVAAELDRMRCEFESENSRVLPDWSAYATLTAEIDGVPAAGDDTRIDAGSRLRIEGSIDEVAHFAMTAGVREFGFRDGSDHWEVFMNPDASAAMVFRNGVHDETRILFAPGGAP